MLPLKGALDQIGQLICSAVYGFIQGCSLMRDSDGMASFEPGFHHATHVVMAAFLIAVLVA
jgi:hypothetical protein